MHKSTKMSGENEKQKELNPLVETVFKPPIANIYINSESQRVLAYIVLSLQRFLGNGNVQQLPPYFDKERKVWSVKVLVKKVPKILSDNASYTAKEIIRKLEPPEEPPLEDDE